MKPTKDEIEMAMSDGQADGAPYDAMELALVFGITPDELYEILSGKE